MDPEICKQLFILPTAAAVLSPVFRGRLETLGSLANQLRHGAPSVLTRQGPEPGLSGRPRHPGDPCPCRAGPTRLPSTLKAKAQGGEDPATKASGAPGADTELGHLLHGDRAPESLHFPASEHEGVLTSSEITLTKPHTLLFK